MKKLLLTLTCLSLLHTAPAEIVEGNVTIQFKVSRQASTTPPPVGPGGELPSVITTKLAYSSYKNANFIQEMGAVFNKEFSKSAKLIFTSRGVGDLRYFIRDKKQKVITDTDVTEHFHLRVRSDVNFSFLNASKIRTGPPITGTQTSYSLGEVLLDSMTAGEENLRLQGSYVVGLRIIKSKEEENPSVGITSITLTGHGEFLYPGTNPLNAGLIQGTVKLSGGKVLPPQKG